MQYLNGSKLIMLNSNLFLRSMFSKFSIMGTIAIALNLMVVAPGRSELARSARVQAIEGKGQVRVQRDNPTRRLFAREDMELDQGDLVIPDRGMSVEIVCPNGLTRSVTQVSGLGSVCPKWRTDMARGSQASVTVGGIDVAVPYLISPRHTLLLDGKPTLRWNQVAGAKIYTVTVMGPKGTVWETRTQAAQVVYGGPELQPGVAYSWVVKVEGGRSSEEDQGTDGTVAKALDFRVLQPAEVKAVRASVAQLTVGKPTASVRALMVASLYGDYAVPTGTIGQYGLEQGTVETYSLSGEAIAVLEQQIKAGKGSPILYRSLGDLYWQTGLIRLAGETYGKAIAEVMAPQDLEEWTTAQYGLAKVMAVMGDRGRMQQSLAQARMGFVFLGNAGKAAELQRRIEQLEKGKS